MNHQGLHTPSLSSESLTIGENRSSSSSITSPDSIGIDEDTLGVGRNDEKEVTSQGDMKGGDDLNDPGEDEDLGNCE